MKNRKPQILFIMPLPPPVHGASMMCECVKNSKCIADAFERFYVNLSPSRNLQEMGHGNLKKFSRYLLSFFRTFYFLVFHRIELCYIAPSVMPMGVLKDFPFILLCKIFRKKVLLHLHGKGYSKYAKSHWYQMLAKMIFRRSKVILLSRLLYEDIRQWVKEEDTVVCPNGIPVSDAVLRCNNQDRKNRQILFLSNLVISKGVLELLDACALLKQRHCSFQCIFAGKSRPAFSSERMTEEIQNRGLEKDVFYLGPKYGTDKEKIFAESGIFVFPTFYHNETFGLVLLEAMQAGLPVISTPEGGIPDLVIPDKNGLLVEQHNVQQLADALERLLNDPELCRKMGKEGRQLFLQQFTQDCFEKKLLHILETATE